MTADSQRPRGLHDRGREAVPAYERDPYLRSLDVEVIATGVSESGRPFARLDDTVLYPEGGGQPADRGRLAGVEVVDVQRDADGVRHDLAAPVEPGPARLELDWPRRYDHMQQHTAQHLLSAVALGRFDWATRSFHVGPERCDIELDRPPLDERRRWQLESAVNREVAAARVIRCRRVAPRELERLEVRSRGLPEGLTGDIRLVEIEGLDLNTCGGTHLRSTAEVGSIQLLGSEPLRGGCRLHWVAGDRVRRRLAAHEARNETLRSLLDTGDDELARVAELKLEQLGDARRRIRALERQLAAAAASRLAASAGLALESHFEDADAGFLQQVARAYREQGGTASLLLTAAGGGQASFLLAVGEPGPDLRRAGGEIAKLLDGRGGGSGRIFQGRAGSLAARDAATALLERLAAEAAAQPR